MDRRQELLDRYGWASVEDDPWKNSRREAQLMWMQEVTHTLARLEEKLNDLEARLIEKEVL